MQDRLEAAWVRMRADRDMHTKILHLIARCRDAAQPCEGLCSRDCEGYPHLDPIATNYCKTMLESKRLNKTECSRGKLGILFDMLQHVMSYLGPSLIHQLTGGTGDIEDVDLNDANYSDDDQDIYFKEKDLVEYLHHIEEDNLFKINLLQDDE